MSDTFEKLCRELVEFIRQKHSVPPETPLTCPILRRMEQLLNQKD